MRFDTNLKSLIVYSLLVHEGRREGAPIGLLAQARRKLVDVCQGLSGACGKASGMALMIGVAVWYFGDAINEL